MGAKEVLISSITVKNTPAEIIAIIMIMDVIFQPDFIVTCHCVSPWTFSFHKHEGADMMPSFLSVLSLWQILNWRPIRRIINGVFLLPLIHHSTRSLALPGWAAGLNDHLQLAPTTLLLQLSCCSSLTRGVLTVKNKCKFLQIISWSRSLCSFLFFFFHSTFFLKHAAMLSIIAWKVRVERECLMCNSGHELIRQS